MERKPTSKSQNKQRQHEIDQAESVCTALQRRYVWLLVNGPTNVQGNKGRAYSQAYGTEDDYNNGKAQSISSNARQALCKPHVHRLLDLYRREMLIEQDATIVGHIHRLGKLRDAAAAGGHMMAAVKAERSIGEAAGHYIQRIEIDQQQASVADVEQRMVALLQRNPALLQIAADRYPAVAKMLEDKRVAIDVVDG